MRPRIADYELVRPLGDGGHDGQPTAGGEGETGDEAGVYLARPPERLGTGHVHVVLHTSPGDSPAGAPWVRQLASAQSANLPTLLELGPDHDGPPGSIYWVHTWTGQDTLARPSFTLSMAHVLWLVASAARGAHAMHEVGLAHGEITPGLIRFNQQVATLDPPSGTGDHPPGLVRRLGHPADLDLMEPGEARGELPSRASDVWALGAILHDALSGQLLHPTLPSEPPVTAIQRIMFEAPTVAAGLDPEAARIINSCLAPDPRHRPQSAAALADQLETLGRQR